MNPRCEELRTAMAGRLGEFPNVHQTEEIKRHLEGCPTCRAHLAALEADDQLLAAFAGSLRPCLSCIEDWTMDAVQTSSPVRSNVSSRWRTKDVCAALAVAAVLCVIAALAVRFFESLVGSSVGLAQTLETMRSMAWVHTVESGTKGGGFETWRRVDGGVIATRGQDGFIRYANHADRVAYEYNPNSNRVTVSLLALRYVPARDETPLETVARIIKSAEQAGAEVSREAIVGREANTEIIRLDYPDGSSLASTTLIRDTSTNLLLSMECIRYGEGARITWQAAFDYPDSGPQDVYALGAPVDATLHDMRPSESVMAVVDRIRERFDLGLGDHQAVVLESEIQDDATYLPLDVSVIRQKGQLKRWDYYHAFSFQGLALPYPGQPGQWPNLTIPQVFDIIASGAMKPSRQMLFDGSRTVTRQVDRGKAEIRESGADEFKGPCGVSFTCYLPNLIWPDLYYELLPGASAHSRPEAVELPADPNRPGLVGLRIARFAETRDYWFDPARDYMLMERVEVRQCVSTRRESVRRLGRTSAGVWYPCVIETESTNLGPDGVPGRTQRREVRILFEENPDIDDALFSPATLTGTSSQLDRP